MNIFNLKSYININPHSQTGQVLIVLVLVTLVALTVGLAITQRTISDISISTKTEQSSRAFSAAEAGLEQVISQEVAGNTPATIPTSDLTNQSTYQVTPQFLPVPEQVLEYPKRSKAEFAHFWLADPSSALMPTFYNRSSITVYFGNSIYSDPQNFDLQDLPAAEVNIITESLSGGSRQYISNRYLLDSVNRNNGFTVLNSTECDRGHGHEVWTTFSSARNQNPQRAFLCRKELTFVGRPILVRVRILYSDNSQAVAVGAPINLNRASCTSIPTYPGFSNCDLPPQINLYNSIGVSGQSRRKLQLFRQKYVVPFYFDYAIFSTFAVIKN